MTADRDGSDEGRLATGALKALLILGVPVTAVAVLVAGWPGAVGALAGLTLVAILFASAAALLRLVAGRSPSTVVAVLVMGLVGRLLAYAAVLAGLGWLGGVHRPTVAVTAGLAIAVVLAYEMHLLARMPRLFWIDPDADRPRAVPNATRSQPL